MHRQHQQGVTLVELLVALATGSTLLAGVYGMFFQQQRVYSLHEQHIEMQQNVRMGMEYLGNDIRMVGYDPTGGARPKILLATADKFRFTMDNNDGDPSTVDDIAYELDRGQRELTRNINRSGRQPVVNHIVDLQFCYFLDDSADCIPNPQPADFAHLRAVQVGLTARTAYPDLRYVHPVHHNHYRTTTLTSTIRMRNLGLKRG